MHKDVKGNPGVPYWLPAVGLKIDGLFAEEEGEGPVSFCHVDLSGSEVSVSGCKKDMHGDVDWYWGIGHALAVCGSDPLAHYAGTAARTIDYEPIFGLNMDSGDLTDEYHILGDFPVLEAPFFVGALTCSP